MNVNRSSGPRLQPPAQSASVPRAGLNGPALRLLLPSDGDLYQPSLDFLNGCGLPVRRPNARRYTATIPAIAGVEVLFQRTADITAKVEEGSAELGITGLDRLLEYREDERRAAILVENLGFGRCELVLAVPDSWLDVTSLAGPGGSRPRVQAAGKATPHCHQVPTAAEQVPVRPRHQLL